MGLLDRTGIPEEAREHVFQRLDLFPTELLDPVLRDYRPQEHPYWPTEYIPAEREAAWAKFEPKFEADPELRASAEGYKKYCSRRR